MHENSEPDEILSVSQRSRSLLLPTSVEFSVLNDFLTQRRLALSRGSSTAL